MALHNQYDDGAYTLTLEQSLTSPPPTFPREDSLPTLSFDLVVEILCRLPVKFLLQFRTVCKSWNSLISDPKFAKKHLGLSATHNINSIDYSYSQRRYIFESFPLDSIFSTIYTNARQLEYPPNGFDEYDRPNCSSFIVGSCNGIICLVIIDYHVCFVQVWNPSIRKFKELPSLEKPKDPYYLTPTSYGFGYDHVNDNYKVVVIFNCVFGKFGKFGKAEIKVHTLGTNFWKSVEGFPLGCIPINRSGTFISDTINWLLHKDGRVQSFIGSFDVRTESYQEILHPDYGDLNPEGERLSLGVLRDCLCLNYDHNVWIMKEFGNIESWTKLFSNSDPGKYYYYLSKPIHMFADDQVLLEASYSRAEKLILLDPKYGIVKSLISP